MFVGKYLRLFQHTALGTTPLWAPFTNGPKNAGDSFHTWRGFKGGGLPKGSMHSTFNVFVGSFPTLQRWAVSRQSPGFCWVRLCKKPLEMAEKTKRVFTKVISPRKKWSYGCYGPLLKNWCLGPLCKLFTTLHTIILGCSPKI